MTYQSAWVALSRTIPAFILSVSAFLLIDNFTYTIFRFGVISTEGLWGLCYSLLFLIIFSFAYKWLLRMEKMAVFSSLNRKKMLIVISLPVISLIGVLTTHRWPVSDNGDQRAVPDLHVSPYADSSKLDDRNAKRRSESLVQRPNILLIATDGLNAERMSVYGYKRNTTPFIEAFTKGRSLFCENAFSNATTSGASIASMLTGKLPTDIRLYYPPDILRGEDAFQHLPAILRSYGYRNIDFGIRYYADAYDLTMMKSFDESNFRRSNQQEWIMLATSVVDNNILYFLNLLKERVQSRFLQMLCLREMTNPFEEVTSKKVVYFNKKLPKFFIKNRVFSKGQEQKEDMMDDFFDDAVLEYDLFFKEIIQALKSRDRLKNTVIVIHTDHGMSAETTDRLPLIFVFPDRSHAARITSNVQNLDIAVTLLDYMAIPRPHWIKGHSLISGEPPRRRPVFISSNVQPKLSEKNLLAADKANYEPPFYNLGKISMIICNKNYELILNPPMFRINTIKGHTAPCSETEVLSKEAAFGRIIDYLLESGYWGAEIGTSLAN